MLLTLKTVLRPASAAGTALTIAEYILQWLHPFTIGESSCRKHCGAVRNQLSDLHHSSGLHSSLLTLAEIVLEDVAPLKQHI